MVHYLVVDVFRGGLKLLGRSPAGLSELTTEVLLVLFVAATIGIAALAYRFVEEPSRVYLNRVGWPWPQRAPATEKLVDVMSAVGGIAAGSAPVASPPDGLR
jgi:peptidoglycan/LPS O-acetylase OafA/YrhL